ncbi:MAG: hypothetical protein JSV35_04500 [Candidatus Bathyarchaeota archaeon]|nr:MAG: hypothetical protein JSV35_04500 [Candidatus Bathyarchaeota archaeon]
MKDALRSRKGLSTVVTTLIILVVSVLLSAIVTFYAINVTTTRVQEESLQIYKEQIWHNGIDFSEAAFLIVNTGGRDVVIDSISVRGQTCAWNTVYYNKTSATPSEELPYVTPTGNGTLLGRNATVGSTTYDLAQANSDLILKSSWSMIVYITDPDSVSVNDVGVTVGFTVFTSNAQYHKECNVDASA